MDGFQDAALILVAHGSTVNADSAAPTFLQTDALRRLGIFGEVAEAFIQQEPLVSGALHRVASSKVYVVPFFISEGWFTRQVVPVQLGLKAPAAKDECPPFQNLHGKEVFYCRPVGSHPRMTAVLLERARWVVRQTADAEPPDLASTTLFVAGHGTGYAPGSREAIERQVRRIRDLSLFAAVFGVFLEETPLVAEAWILGETMDRILVPFFISDGLHTKEDIPRMLGESATSIRSRLRSGEATWRNPTEREGRRLWCAPAIGTEPLMVEVILERVREAASGESDG